MHGDLRTLGEAPRSSIESRPASSSIDRSVVPSDFHAGTASGAEGVLSSATRNRLLAAMPPDEQEALMSQMQRVNLRADERLGRPGAAIDQVYFPERCVIAVSPDGQDEVELIDYHGLMGLELALGQPVAATHAVSRIPGVALRLDASAFQRALAELPSLRPLLGAYTQTRLLALARTASCGRRHTLGPRLASMLLGMQEAAQVDRLTLTHDQIARLLGISRRASVTDALRLLQAQHLVSLHRRGVTITDVAGLMETACSCQAQRPPFVGPIALTA